MSLTIENTQQISADVYAEGTAGADRIHVAALTFSYRPGKRMGLSLEILNENAAAKNKKDVARQVETFIAEAFALAAQTGLPAPAIGSGESGK